MAVTSKAKFQPFSGLLEAMRDNKAPNIQMIKAMFPSYVLLIVGGVVLALVCSRLPEPAWNKVAMVGLAIAVALIVIGFGIYRDS